MAAYITLWINIPEDNRNENIPITGQETRNFPTIDEYNWSYEGHLFLYWNTLSNGSGTIYHPGDKIPAIEQGYYAIWEVDTNYVVKKSELISIADAIREKSNTDLPLEFPNEFVSAIGDISTGGSGSTASAPAKAVNFRDYDGTVVYSYTPAEFAALTAMPANPDHSGDAIPLTSQGWNWSLSDAQAYVAKYGRLEVGQMYATTDGKTHVLIHLEQGRTSPILGCCPNGTVEVDWGDGTAHDTLTGTSVMLVKWTPRHEYAAPGDYDIKLACTGTMGFYGSSSTDEYSGLLRYLSQGNKRNRVYQNAVQAVYCAACVTSIGSNAFQYCCGLSSVTIPDSVTSIGIYAFSCCFSLSSITIPDSVTSIGQYAFNSCYGLSSVTIPDSVTSIGIYTFTSCYSLSSVTIPDSVTRIEQYAFYGCYSLSSVTIPDSVTSIGSSAFRDCCSLSSITIPDSVTRIEQYAFYGCYSLSSVTIPDSVTSIGSSAFQNCYGLAELHFYPATPPTVAKVNAFQNLPTDCKIYVPTGSLETYTTATNYPSSSTYTYIEE